jgi:hypothetical protein
MERVRTGRLRLSTFLILLALIIAALSGIAVLSQTVQEPGPFPPPRNEPPIVTPGLANSDPPSDALVLFDGKDLSHWRSTKDGNEAKWQTRDGYLEVAPKTGDIATREEFGDCQLHIEWAAPAVVKGEGQGRGNSGVFLMQRYEVQVLDSYKNKTYYHGQAGAVYKQYAPLVNASREPGQWQSYDIIFKAPKFDDQGRVTDRARITVLHNGVLIQNNVEIYGNTWHDRPALYIAHAAKAPLQLQDHGDLVRYRNIWIRQL